MERKILLLISIFINAHCSVVSAEDGSWERAGNEQHVLVQTSSSHSGNTIDVEESWSNKRDELKKESDRHSIMKNTLLTEEPIQETGSVMVYQNNNHEWEYIDSENIVEKSLIEESSTPSLHTYSTEPSYQQSQNPSLQGSAIPSQKTNHPSTHSTMPSEAVYYPSSRPTSQPSSNPSFFPSVGHSDTPSLKPTNTLSQLPSSNPNDSPSSIPTFSPTSSPSLLPTMKPSVSPSQRPSSKPSSEISSRPSNSPSLLPTQSPSSKPTSSPSVLPTLGPSVKPSVLDSNRPSLQSSNTPTFDPTLSPSDRPSLLSSHLPTLQNSSNPSFEQTHQPSTQQSGVPTSHSSPVPSDAVSSSTKNDWEYNAVFEDIEPSSSPSTRTTSEVPTVSESEYPTSSTEPDTQNNGKKPNILLIFADDVGQGDIPVYFNSSLVHMPNIQKLSNEGVTFLNIHSTPLCAPSRYMLLSGNYQHRGNNANGAWNLDYENNQFQRFQKSLPSLLEKNGYRNHMAGKWHLGAKVPPLGLVNRTHFLSSPYHDWTLPLIDGPQSIGFHESFITTGGIQEAPYSFFRNGILTTNTTTEVRYWEEGSYDASGGKSVILREGEGDISWDSSSYNMIVVNETTRFINEHMETTPEDPFFAYVALGSVHIPHSPPNYYLNGEPIANQYPNGHLDLLNEMDHIVGSLVSLIEEKGLADDTIIIFSSDNGGLRRDKSVDHFSSGPYRGHKGEIFEGGHRIPLIFRGENIPKGERRDHLVGLNDIYATIADVVGAKVPKLSAQDSISFKDYLYNREMKQGLRESLGVFDYKNGMIQADSLIKGNMKLIRYYPIYSGAPSHVELYDLEADISESMDISGNPKHAGLIAEMTEELISIGPCPKDQEEFPIYMSAHDLGFNTTCRFFSKKPHRCSKFLEGELFCNSICGRHDKVCYPEKYANKGGSWRRRR